MNNIKYIHIYSLVFSVGNLALSGFRMIERHYFRDRLVKSFDFTFGFCIPGSTNTWDAVYSMPALSDELSKSEKYYFYSNLVVAFNSPWVY